MDEKEETTDQETKFKFSDYARRNGLTERLRPNREDDWIANAVSGGAGVGYAGAMVVIGVIAAWKSAAIVFVGATFFVALVHFIWMSFLGLLVALAGGAGCWLAIQAGWYVTSRGADTFKTWRKFRAFKKNGGVELLDEESEPFRGPGHPNPNDPQGAPAPS